jgi:hypothetical protein
MVHREGLFVRYNEGLLVNGGLIIIYDCGGWVKNKIAMMMRYLGFDDCVKLRIMSMDRF